MLYSLDDAWARAEWAHDALEALTLALEDFRDDHPYAVTDEVDLPAMTRIIRASQPVQPPSAIRLLFADLLGGLRAALNHAACAAVSTSSRRGRHAISWSDLDDIVIVTPEYGFPIATTEAAFDRLAAVQLKGASAAVIEYVRSVQPFGPDGISEPLARLELLDLLARQRLPRVYTSLAPVPSPGIEYAVSDRGQSVEARIALDPSNPREVPPWRIDATVLVGPGPGFDEPLLDVARDVYADVTQYVLPGFIEEGLLSLTRPRRLPEA